MQRPWVHHVASVWGLEHTQPGAEAFSVPVIWSCPQTQRVRSGCISWTQQAPVVVKEALALKKLLIRAVITWHVESVVKAAHLNANSIWMGVGVPTRGTKVFGYLGWSFASRALTSWKKIQYWIPYKIFCPFWALIVLSALFSWFFSCIPQTEDIVPQILRSKSLSCFCIIWTSLIWKSKT